MNKQKIITIGGLLLLLIVAGLTVWFLTSDSENEQSTSKNESTSQKAEPALTREKDEETEEQQKVEAEQKRQEEEQRNSEKAKKEDEKQSVSSLKKDAEFVLTKSITGKSDEDDPKLSETATKDLGSNLPDEEEQDADKKDVEIKNFKLDFDKKPDMKSDKLQGTITFDLIIKPKNDSDIKPKTQIDTKRSITFKREDEKLKVNELRS
jgi:hypothetical protein